MINYHKNPEGNIKYLTRLAVVSIVQKAWGLVGWKAWLVIKLWDTFWIMVCAPLIRHEKDVFQLNKRIKSRQALFEKAKNQIKNKKDFVKTMEELWRQRH